MLDVSDKNIINYTKGIDIQKHSLKLIKEDFLAFRFLIDYHYDKEKFLHDFEDEKDFMKQVVSDMYGTDEKINQKKEPLLSYINEALQSINIIESTQSLEKINLHKKAIELYHRALRFEFSIYLDFSQKDFSQKYELWLNKEKNESI